MQRLLFYAVTAFVFLLRPYDWLIAVGMTFVLTFAGAASIHAFLLSILDGIGPDSDVLALQGIILSTSLAVYCYWIGSQRIFKHAIMPLCYICFLAMEVSLLATGSSRNGILGNPATFIVPAGCSADGKCDPGACSNATSHGLFRSEMDQLVPMALEQWMYYNASNVGRWEGSYPSSETFLGCDDVSCSDASTSGNLLRESAFYYLYRWHMLLAATFLVIIPIVVSPLLFNPSKSRNVLFFHLLIRFKTFGNSFFPEAGLWITLTPWLRLFIYQSRNPKAQNVFESVLFRDLPAAPEVKPRHINVAKLLASCWFVCSWSAGIIMLMLPVVTVVVSELGLGGLPEAEAPWLVGQWAPFIYVVLALLTSVTLKFINYWCDAVQKSRYLIFLDDPDLTELLKLLIRCLTEEYKRNLLLSRCLVGKEFKIWWKDPVTVARQDYEDVRRQIQFELKAERRRVAKKRQIELSCVGDNEPTKTDFAELVEELEFDEIWKRLSASASGSQNHRDWSTQIPCTFTICRMDNHGNSLADTGWITAAYEEEEYERMSTAEIKRRQAKALEDQVDREQLADSLETFIGDILESSGFELR